MRRRMILVVEDDDDLAREIVELLHADGHRASAVRTVGAALRFTGGVTPALVLVDLRLEDGMATGLLAQLATATDGPPVLVISGVQDAEQIAAQFALPLLKKPFTLDALVGAVRASLQSPRRPSRAG